MLGTEPQLVANFVDKGLVRMVFWPVLNHGQPSVNATLANHCVGLQDPELFWEMHHLLFENHDNLWRADYQFYYDAAVGLGVDADEFGACYGSQDTINVIVALDTIRQERGIFGQPYFDINGTIYAGAAPYDIFADVIEQSLP